MRNGRCTIHKVIFSPHLIPYKANCSPHEEKSNRGNSNDCENTRACPNPPNTVPYPDQNVITKCEGYCTRSVTNLLTKFQSMVDNDMQDNNGRNYCYHLTNYTPGDNGFLSMKSIHTLCSTWPFLFTFLWTKIQGGLGQWPQAFTHFKTQRVIPCGHMSAQGPL